MKLVLALVAVVGVIAWLAVGLIVAQGPQPEIIVPAEVITTVGPINISNTMITAWTVMAVIIILSLLATRSMSLLPSGFQNFVEAAMEFLYDQVTEIAGEKNGRRFFVVIATFFLFIIVSNWFGLLPFFNAIGKTEDVGYHVFHEIAEHDAEEHAFEEAEHFGMWRMDETGGIGLVKPRASDATFEIHAEEEPGEALDRYIVFLATEFTDFEVEGFEEEGYHASAADVEGAAAALAAEPSAPKLLMEEHAEEGAEGEGEAHHAVASAALGDELTVSAVDFPEQKLALIIPYFRSVFSDINNTLALAICSFLIVEFWGFQTLGFRYLGKFFVNPIKNPIGTFVGFLELISEFIRIISFAFRLFGNIFAGEVLILMLTFLMPFLFVDLIYGLELFVGFIQAAVFALLTLVFAVMAIEHHGEDHDEEGHDSGHAADDHHPGAVQTH